MFWSTCSITATLVGSSSGQTARSSLPSVTTLTPKIQRIRPATMTLATSSQPQVMLEAQKVEAEIVRIIGLVVPVEGEVRVDILVGAEVEHDDAPEECQHRDVLGQEADEDIAYAHLLVRHVALRVHTDDGEEPMERFRHQDRRHYDKAAG